nr:hypothetical protein MANES_11G030500 [Ipomoea batatas]GMC55693.1 hypothetical protein MANES_11G030500 [Ipomoea batatas]GMD79288.1 hypothetical protein MANES_11G030500 [Ipomoea batatas]
MASNFSLRSILVSLFIVVILISAMMMVPSDAARFREKKGFNHTTIMYCPTCVGCCEPPPAGFCCQRCGC